MTQGVQWRVLVPEREAPPLDADLSGWTVYHQRRSHLNAMRSVAGRVYHLKWFFRRLFRGNPARRELENARSVEALGIPTVLPIGWGTHACGTFFVMEGSPGQPIYALAARPDSERLDQLSRELGRLIATLHNAGLCHRDLYVDHVLIDGDDVRLIDLGRVMRFRRRRWIVKDLGGLLFSAWREDLPARASRRFLASYVHHSHAEWRVRTLIQSLQRKARGYWRHNRLHPQVGSSVSGQRATGAARGAASIHPGR